MRNTIFSIITITIFILMSFTDGMSQRCNNTLVNPNAQKGENGWQTHQQAGTSFKSFVVKTSDSHLYQDVKIPARSKFAYFGGWSKNSKKATVGHGYLYGYIMDANDKILEYVQLGVQNETTSWKYQSKKVNLTAAAKKVRFFLKKSSKKDVTDQRNIASFDNLILSFNCGKPTANPGVKTTCKNSLKNHNARQDKASWTFNQSASVVTVGGQKSFAVKTSGSHISQDVVIPSGSRSAYFGGWTRNSKMAKTGQAYLYGYVMDANDKILEYVQLGVVNKTTKWGYQDKTVTLTGAAKKIRFFLKRSNINGVTDVNNVAYFDNLSLSFNCSKKTTQPRTTSGSACRNLLKNPNGGRAATWKAHKEAEVKNGVFTVKKATAHLYQDVNIPSGSRYAYLAGFTKNLRPVATGHAYLYAYIMDANDKILEYVQFGTPSNATTWKLSEKTVTLTAAAKKVRFFLKKSSKKDVADSKNYALFDNLKVSFNCKKKPTTPRK